MEREQELLVETLQKMTAAMAELSRQLTVEKDMVQLLFALAAAHNWNVQDALEGARAKLSEAGGGTEKDQMLRDTYLVRTTQLLQSAGRKTS